jgi:hypothetical protein
MSQLKSIRTEQTRYDADFAGWSAEQATQLRRLKPAGLDWNNLAEEIESLGRSDRRAIGSALKVVLEHLIKWRFQPDKRSSSWRRSIDEHRDRISRILEDSPSLRNVPGEALAAEYRRARRDALGDTGLAPRSVPVVSPFSAEEVLDPDFWPNGSQSTKLQND